uniref:Ankyrin repeat domain containing 50 n=1 Tax=Eptatretus burgeri TaxID=7764 RepID=A0A8C4R4F4_EPTBU
MAQSLLEGKAFYCREWAFERVQRCAAERRAGGAAGVLVLGGPGVGKTAFLTELVWPTTSAGRERGLHTRVLAAHFCQTFNVDTLCPARFVHHLYEAVAASHLLPHAVEALGAPAAVSARHEAETSPDTALSRGFFQPLLSLDSPPHCLLLVVDSIDEGEPADSLLGANGGPQNERQGDEEPGTEEEARAEGLSLTIAELLARQQDKLPPWLLLVVSAQRKSRSLTRLFSGYRRVILDDLRRSAVLKDVQRYILARLDISAALRRQLTPQTAQMLNHLHIKSDGCFLYLERVLDGAAEGSASLREVREIPGTLNGLYLWLCQRVFARRGFARLQPLLNAALAARRPLSAMELRFAITTRNSNISADDFERRLAVLSRILIPVETPKEALTSSSPCRLVLFHSSFAAWLLDVKHCTQRYLCSSAEGHAMLAVAQLCQPSGDLSPQDSHDLAHHLAHANLRLPPVQLALCVTWRAMPFDYRSPSELQRLATRHENTLKSRDATENPTRDTLREPLDQWDDERRTLLAISAANGDSDKVAFLASRGADVEVVDNCGRTPLNLAARHGHLGVVSLLLRLGAEVDRVDAEGWTPLRSAAWGGHRETVAALLAAGAEVDRPDLEGRTALRAAAWGGHEGIVIDLLNQGANADKEDLAGRTPLLAAAYMGHAEIARHLLDRGANIDHADSDGRTALAVAALCVPASRGHASVTALLLERRAMVNSRDSDGLTPLIVAAYEGRADIVELLLEGGADADLVDGAHRTPLLAASAAGRAKAVSTLLFWGAAVDAIDGEGRTALGVAAAGGSASVVRLLLDRGLDESHRDDLGWTPLHHAAAGGHKDACEVLLDHSACPDERDNVGRGPLVLAALEGHAPCVRLLLHKGSAVDRPGFDGRSPLRVAALENHRDVVEILLDHGADVNAKDSDGRPTLYLLALTDKMPMANLLLERRAEVDGRDADGRTALHAACWMGHRDMAALLLSKGANPDAPDKENRTPLQSAAWRGHVDLVSLLLSTGAAADQACSQGATPLAVAAQEGHVEVVRLLLTHGAAPERTDALGRTPTRVAARGGHLKIVRMLETAAVGCSKWTGDTQPVTGLNTANTTSIGSAALLALPPTNNTVQATKTPSSTLTSTSSDSGGGGVFYHRKGFDASCPEQTGHIAKGRLASSSIPGSLPGSGVQTLQSSSNASRQTTASSLSTSLSGGTAQTVPFDALGFAQQIAQHSLPRSRSQASLSVSQHTSPPASPPATSPPRKPPTHSVIKTRLVSQHVSHKRNGIVTNPKLGKVGLGVHGSGSHGDKGPVQQSQIDFLGPNSRAILKHTVRMPLDTTPTAFKMETPL